MSFKATWYRDRLRKKAQMGLQGYPVASVAFYGPDNLRASKVVVGIMPAQGAEISELARWTSDAHDARVDVVILEAIHRFLQQHGVKSVVATERILGCPHEEGIDYPKGHACPQCPYWRNRDRFTGELLSLPDQGYGDLSKTYSGRPQI